VRHNNTGGAPATVWAGSAAYDLTDALYVEASAGSAFRLPDAYQLYAIDPDDGIHGNPDLEPEESFNVNLAIGRRAAAGPRSLGWQLTGWKRKVENLIRSVSTGAPAGFDGVYVNTDGHVRQSGMEVLLLGSVAEPLSFEASYMYSRERDAAGRQLANRPEHSGKLAINLGAPGGRWGADLSFKYAGSTYSTSGAGDLAYGDYVVTSLGARLFVDSQQKHRIGMRVENLYDKEYQTLRRSTGLAGAPGDFLVYGNRGTPRTLFANYTFSF